MTSTSSDPSDTAKSCFTTSNAPPPPPEEPEEYVDTIWLTRHAPPVGFMWWDGAWGPINDATLLEISVPDQLIATEVHFVKPGHTTSECGDPSAVVTVNDGATMTEAQMIAAFTTAMPFEWVPIVACIGTASGLAPTPFPLNVRYVK